MRVYLPYRGLEGRIQSDFDAIVNVLNGDISGENIQDLSIPASKIIGSIGGGGDGGEVLGAARNPTSADGSEGDWWINTATGGMWGPKTGTTWPYAFSMVGATGATGAVGPPGPQGVQGVPGGLVYSQIIGNGMADTFAISHNFFSKGVGVTVYRSEAPYDEVIADVEYATPDMVIVKTPNIPPVNGLIVSIAAPGSPSSGGGGDDKNYIHVKSPLSASWTVNHNLGKWPVVTVVDTGDNVLVPDVHYIDNSSLTVTFAAPTSGKAVCN